MPETKVAALHRHDIGNNVISSSLAITREIQRRPTLHHSCLDVDAVLLFFGDSHHGQPLRETSLCSDRRRGHQSTANPLWHVLPSTSSYGWLIGITIPFAFATGALLAGKTADEWVDPGRVWGIISWALLASGLLLGSWWAYTILGWGGFWFWDPVENAAFMPWLGITAFIHSIMVQKRKGMFRMWNIVLVNVSFGLALYGMFMNRAVRCHPFIPLENLFRLDISDVPSHWRHHSIRHLHLAVSAAKKRRNLDPCFLEKQHSYQQHVAPGNRIRHSVGHGLPITVPIYQRRRDHGSTPVLRSSERATDASLGVPNGDWAADTLA
ncbi:MAG: hypothetical protein Ct9H300mP11_30530 [Chloroflexota bacterium]|nr:MAG: hypothetical protein Ct9H300mP11_30530 [Chloroflexota bacterium]